MDILFVCCQVEIGILHVIDEENGRYILIQLTNQATARYRVLLEKPIFDRVINKSPEF
jgi:hypothetical protein